MYYVLICLCPIPDHPIHPPSGKDNPWDCEFAPSSNHILKFEDGVCRIFADEEAMKRDEEKDYPYPKLDQYIRDMKILCVMIADGPLYVIQRSSHVKGYMNLKVDGHLL